MTSHATIELLKAIRLQLVILFLALLALLLPASSAIHDFPNVLMRAFMERGLPIIAGASFLENLPGISLYFPGSIVILVGMASTAGDPNRAFAAYAAIVVPAVLANVISYWLGSLSRHRRTNKTSLPPRSIALWYLTTYWHPQLAALTAVASGEAGLSFSRYLKNFLPISLFWTVVWALTLYRVGTFVDPGSALKPLFYVYLIVWTAWSLISHIRSRRLSR